MTAIAAVPTHDHVQPCRTRGFTRAGLAHACVWPRVAPAGYSRATITRASNDRAARPPRRGFTNAPASP
ncbi:MAG: hypothetical protein RIQ60_3243 [Pseudomonadota bacterium]|jgi:hypothetical protein